MRLGIDRPNCLAQPPTMSTKIPPSIIGLTAPILEDAYTHAELDTIFMQSGFDGEPPTGNKRNKCMTWLRHANNSMRDPLAAYGQLIAEFMDSEVNAFLAPTRTEQQAKLQAGLEREGLRYVRGGRIVGASLHAPSKSLAERLKSDRHETIQREFDRANEHVDSDPPAAVTAASAILEALCKEYLAANALPLPSSQTLAPLWSATSAHLGLSPKDVVGSDLKQILSGLSSIAAGVAALRTHKGSAHGHSADRSDEPDRIYRLAPRHARLAVHAAHTMADFVIETWDARLVK